MPTQPRLTTEKTADLPMGGTKNRTLLDSIAVARLVMRLVSSTLGPLGMNKIVILKPKEGNKNRKLLTGDSALILDSVRTKHPIGRLLADLAKTQKEECGDGATIAVVLACSLLENAEELLKMGLHPSTIIEGYSLAEEKSVQTMENKLFTTIDVKNDAGLLDFVRPLINSRGISNSPDAIELFSGFVVTLLRAILVESDPSKLDSSDISEKLDNIKIIKKTGGLLADSELILHGFIIEDREIVHPNMPRSVTSASIALVKSLEVKKLKGESGTSPFEAMKVEVSSERDYKQFMQNRSKFAESIVRKIVETGANVALVNMGIDELVEHYLMRHEILAVKRVKNEDMELIAKLTDGTIVSNVDDISLDMLGKAELIEEMAFGEQDHCIKISGSRGAGAASVLLRASSGDILDEAERSLKLAIRASGNLMIDPRVVPGGGATEMELAQNLENYALSFSTKEQFAIKQYARSLEVIPRTLAENSGLDAMETITSLRNAHRRGLTSFGVDVLHGTCIDVREKRILDLLSTKVSAIKRASEATTAILRISDIEKGKRHPKSGKEDAMKREESGNEDATQTPIEHP